MQRTYENTQTVSSRFLVPQFREPKWEQWLVLTLSSLQAPRGFSIPSFSRASSIPHGSKELNAVRYADLERTLPSQVPWACLKRITSTYLLALRKKRRGGDNFISSVYYADLPNCLLLFVYLGHAPTQPPTIPPSPSLPTVFLSVGAGWLLSWFNQLIIAEQVQGNYPDDAIWSHIFSEPWHTTEGAT